MLYLIPRSNGLFFSSRRWKKAIVQARRVAQVYDHPVPIYLGCRTGGLLNLSRPIGVIYPQAYPKDSPLSHQVIKVIALRMMTERTWGYYSINQLTPLDSWAEPEPK